MSLPCVNFIKGQLAGGGFHRQYPVFYRDFILIFYRADNDTSAVTVNGTPANPEFYRFS